MTVSEVDVSAMTTQAAQPAPRLQLYMVLPFFNISKVGSRC